MDEFLRYTALAVFGLLMVYLAARLITAAYFKSKQQHERQTNHG